MKEKVIKTKRSKTKYTPEKPEREPIPFNHALAMIWAARKKKPR